MGVSAHCACCCPLASIPQPTPYIHLSTHFTHFLPSCFFLVSFPSLPVSPPTPSDYCSVYQSFRRLTHQATQVVTLTCWGGAKTKTQHPNHTGQVACSCSGRLVASAKQPTAILLLAPNYLAHSFVQSIASSPRSHFSLLHWCGVSPKSLQDYTV